MLLFHVPCKFVIRPHLSPLPVPQLPELLSNRNRLADTFFWSRHADICSASALVFV